MIGLQAGLSPLHIAAGGCWLGVVRAMVAALLGSTEGGVATDAASTAEQLVGLRKAMGGLDKARVVIPTNNVLQAARGCVRCLRPSEIATASGTSAAEVVASAPAFVRRGALP